MSGQSSPSGWVPVTAPSSEKQKLQDICEKRRQAFQEAFGYDKTPPMTYTEPTQYPAKILVWHRPKGGYGHRGAVLALEGFSMDEAVVVWHDHYNEFFSPALWVNQKSRKYREAYARFLAVFHGYQGQHTVAELGYDVDHLRSLKRTPEGTYIRVEACPHVSNRRWGATYERTSTRDFFKPFRPRGTADWTTAAKLAGVLPPNDWSDQAGMQRLFDFVVHTNPDLDSGISRHLIVEDIMRAYLPRKKDKESLMQMKDQHHRNPLSEHIVPWRG